MTENKGDLISREALKKAFDDYIKANPNISGVFELGKFIIDNAPTVKAENASLLSENDLETIRTILNAHIGCLCNNGQHTQAIVIEQVRDRLFGVLQSKNERPQGEWKLDDTEQFCYCDQCEDSYYPRPLDPSWNYCPHCGADMRGGAE